MQEIKNIIFDFGGIFININYQLTEDAFVQLGVTNFKALYSQHHASDVFEKLETGKITNQDFYNFIRSAANLPLSNEQISTAWNAMLLDIPLYRLEWLLEIGKKYNVYLYSNTNAIHYNTLMPYANSIMPGKSFDSFFKAAYYSHLFGYRKPYVESYLRLLEKENLNPAETVFIDDTYKNLEGAQQAGMQTIFLEKQDVVNVNL